LIYDVIGQAFVVLALALILGEILEQIGLPAVTGALLAGIVLGPTFLGLVASTPQSQGLSVIALFFIIFTIGLEMKTETIVKHVRSALLVTLTCFIVPLLIAAAVSTFLLPFGLVANFVLSLAITVPSISIISVIVMQRHLLEKPSGPLIISSAAVADIIAFVVLAAVSQSARSTLELLSLVTIILVGFVVVDRLLNRKSAGFQKILTRSSLILRGENVSFAILVVVGLSVSLLFQLIGLTYIIGAFFAGLILHEELIGRDAFGRISRTFNRMNQALFIPVFFGFAGVGANLAPGGYSLVEPLAVVIITATLPAILLTYFAADHLLRDREKGDARNLAVIMAGRGAVGIVVATIASDNGQIGTQEYSLIIIGILVISVIAPLLLREHKPGLGQESEDEKDPTIL
jgi:Kef-type K+ transport system membrane component KefB